MDIFRTETIELTWIQNREVFRYELVPYTLRANVAAGTIVFKLRLTSDPLEVHEEIITKKGDEYWLRSDICAPGEEYPLEAYCSATGAIFHCEDEWAKIFYRFAWSAS